MRDRDNSLFALIVFLFVATYYAFCWPFVRLWAWLTEEA